MDTSVKGQVEFYLREGRWHLLLSGPSWVIGDVLRSKGKDGEFYVENYGGKSDSEFSSTLLSVREKNQSEIDIDNEIIACGRSLEKLVDETSPDTDTTNHLKSVIKRIYELRKLPIVKKEEE